MKPLDLRLEKCDRKHFFGGVVVVFGFVCIGVFLCVPCAPFEPCQPAVSRSAGSEELISYLYSLQMITFTL